MKSLKGEVEAIVLYGSVAVGEASEDSDIDILVVTKSRSRELYYKISSIRTRVDLDNGTLTTLIHMSRNEFEFYLKSGSPFLEKDRRETSRISTQPSIRPDKSSTRLWEGHRLWV